MISDWTGSGEFTVDEIMNNDFIEIVLEKLSGKLASDGKSITLQFEYAYHDEYGSGEESSSKDISGNGSFIDIPFVEHVTRDDAEYDRFAFEGNLDALRPHMQFWHQEIFTSDGEREIDEHTFDSITSCDGPGAIEVWMYLPGLETEP